MDLCLGNLRHSILHPNRKDENLYLLFDFTQCLKNIFNNFLKKNLMHLPSGHESVFGDHCVAEFSHIKWLYALEEHLTLKIAHKLKKSSLNPSSIAKTSPLHAFSKYLKLCTLCNIIIFVLCPDKYFFFKYYWLCIYYYIHKLINFLQVYLESQLLVL